MNELRKSPGTNWETAAVDTSGQAFSGLGKSFGRRSRGARWVAFTTAASDVFALTLAFLLATLVADLLRRWAGFETDQWAFLVVRAPDLALLTAVMIGIFSFGGLYGRSGWEVEELRRIIYGVALVALFDTTLQYITQSHTSRIWFLSAWPFASILIVCMRMALRSMPWVKRASTTSIVLLGNGIPSASFVDDARVSRSAPVRLLVHLPLNPADQPDGEALAIRLRNIVLDKNLRRGQLQIVISPASDEREAAQDLMDHFNMIAQPYSLVLSYHGLAQRGLRLHNVVGADTVLAEVSQDTGNIPQRALKRTLDLTLLAVLAIPFCLVMLVLAALLKLEGGPVFFSQMRVGENRRRFRCLKLRSMRPDAEQHLAQILASDPALRAEWDTHQKLENDPRITRLGHFLRITSLDELPQFYNVLRGEMSLVGPRPIIAPEVPGYPADRVYFESPAFIHYIRCKPGITGLWQVFGRASTSHRERVRLDAWYARNWSIWLDLLILFKTTRVVIARTGI